VAYDYSCGWGGRLLGALSKGLKYYGVDTNPTLCERLKECAKDYAEVNGLSNDIADIRCSGSEVLQSDWVGKVGVAFSSPPYFDMEIYPGDKTSTTTCPDYGKWLEEYWKPTVVNACEYLIDGGYFLVNITDAYYNDMKSVVLNSCPNMKYICDEHYDGGLTHRNAYRHQRDIAAKKPNPERVMVFQKVANIEPYKGEN
jgi:hypothetical protein